MSMTTGRPSPELLTSAVPPLPAGPQREFRVRNEIGDMVKQLHKLRRRLSEIDGYLAQDAVEAVVKACLELDEFLRSPGTSPIAAVRAGPAMRPRISGQPTPRQATLAQYERAHKEKHKSTDGKDGNAFAGSR